MKKVWAAVVCVGLLLAAAAAMIFFSTAGSSWMADRLSRLAATAGPEWGQRLYLWSLEVNPYDTGTRLALAQLYQAQDQLIASQQLLQEGISHYDAGPELYLALAESYTGQGRLEDACALLDSAPESYRFQSLVRLRPKTPAISPSGEYSQGHPFSPKSGTNPIWFRLDGGDWILYEQPLRLDPGEHTLEALALSPEGIPSSKVKCRYHIQPVQPASAPIKRLPAPSRNQANQIQPQ